MATSKRTTNFLKLSTVALALPFFAACDKSPGSDFSLMSAGQGFTQNSKDSVNNQIDVLWVVDNSASMSPLQQNLVNNFHSFIGPFVAKGFDFHMAVTTTDAYRANALIWNQPTLAKFRDGTDATSHTGVFDLLPTTPNVEATFVTNALQGATGSGDERAFSSFREALNSPYNAGFRRPGAFLAVIILSDEDDFSGNNRDEGMGADQSYTASTLDSVQSYVDYLDTLTASTTAHRNYNVSAIAVLDNACAAAHRPGASSTIIGKRYKQLAQATNGALGSICDTSYASALDLIQQHIVELSSQFYLNRTPVLSSLRVTVNGIAVPQDNAQGWSYEASSNSVMFHGSAVPPQGASILIEFDPTTAIN